MAYNIFISIVAVGATLFFALGFFVTNWKEEQGSKVAFGCACVIFGVASFFVIQKSTKEYQNKVTCTEVGKVTKLTCTKSVFSNECRLALDTNQKVNLHTDLVLIGDSISFCKNSVESLASRNRYQVSEVSIPQ